jgi:NAD(P)H-hydrate epimerase
MGIALPADITVTFGYEKLGTMLYPGKGYSGQVKIADIGFPDISLKRIEPEYFTYECSDKKLIPTRPSYSNKGTFGKVLVIAGSENMSGAAYLSALAAYRTGAGLVKLFTVEENRTVLQTQLPEAIITTYQREEVLAMTDDFKALLEEQCQWADVIVLGPGIGQEPYVENLTEAVLEGAFVPIIIDADGLNAIANNPQLTNYFTENMIITPHLGEMARLTGSSVTNIQKNLITTAREYADRFGITCVLKDAVTIAADKDQKTYVNASGNSSMAKAGSGDVLTGIIAGLLALGLEEEKAASLGVWLHGLAGDKVREVNGEHSLLARELAEAIPVIMQQNNRKEEER